MVPRRVSAVGNALRCTLLLVLVAAGGQQLQTSAVALPSDQPDEQSRAAAAEGHIDKELQLAGDYLIGRGIRRSPEQAVCWYRKAADQGDPDAQAELGYFYLAGTGVRADPAEAVRWFSRAMAGGSLSAERNLAVMYLKGMGVRRDLRLGMEMLTQAAHRDDPGAENDLGVAYFLGLGVPVDHRAAEKWFERAAKQRLPEAEYAMGTLYSVVGDHAHDFPRAAQYLRISVQGGYVPALHSLGQLLVNHPEIPQKPGEATAFLEQAAEAGAWRSSAILGALARMGTFAPASPTDACRWFLIAARQGGSEAQPTLKNDLANCTNVLGAQSMDLQTRQADAWLAQHAAPAIFLSGSRLQTGNFPLPEVPDLDLFSNR